MKICLYIADLADGGAQRQFALLANEFAARPDIDLLVVRNRPGGVHDWLVDRDRVTVIDLNYRSNYDPRIVPRLARLMRRLRVDILFSWLQAADVPSYFVRALTPRLKWVLAERNSRHPPDWRFRLRGLLGRRADAIIANSAGGVAYWDQFAPAGVRKVIPNIVASNRRVSADRSSAAGVICIGRLEPHKNVLESIRSFATLAGQDASARLVIAGAGSLAKDVAVECSALQAAGLDVEFVGYVTDPARYMMESKVLLTLSEYEGMPNVLVEAIMAGLVVVASDIPEHRDLLGADYPYLVQLPVSTTAVASILVRAIGDRDVDGTIEYARTQIAEFGAGRIADLYLESFRNLLELG